MTGLQLNSRTVDNDLGEAVFRPTNRGRNEHVCDAPKQQVGGITVAVVFDCSSYPLENHCRFASQPEPEKPYTFPNFVFNINPPGIRVGPWPGWRGIQEMPAAEIVIGGNQTKLDFQFWGDEISCRVLRGIGHGSFGDSKEMLVHCDDDRLVPVKARFYRATPPKPEQASVRIPGSLVDLHPRLLIGQNDLSSLRDSKTRDSDSFHRLTEHLSRWDQSQTLTPESKLGTGTEGLTPEDRALIGAFLAMIDPSPPNVQLGIKSLLEYTDLTRRTDFSPLTIDTQSGEVLFLLCVGYDWLYKHLNDTERQLVRKRCWEIADVCWNHLGYERSDYAQAHYLGCGMGLLAFSILFWNEHPRAQEWCNHLAGVLKLILSLLPSDGFFAHGINLWIYEFGFLLRWLELLRTGANQDFWPENDSLTGASAFRAETTSPDGFYGITFGDPQFRVGGDAWCHYLIARRTGSAMAASLGDLLRDLPVQGVDYRSAPARRQVYEMLWYPADMQQKSDRPAMTLFPDGAQFFCRSGNTVFTFRAGPPLGSHRYAAGVAGGFGHSDPCSGDFLLFAHGSLALAGPGPVYRRDTSLHNVVTINGRGQIGDSAVWMPDFIPPSSLSEKPEFRITDEFAAATVELASSYLPDLGVLSLRRSIAVIPGRYIIGIDRISLTNESSMEWNLHSWGDFIPIKSMPLTFQVKLENSDTLRVICHSLNQSRCQTGLTDFVPAYPNDGRRDRFLRVSSTGKDNAFSWCVALGDDTPMFTADTEGFGLWSFNDGSRLSFDGTWFSREATR